jgi:hypothetical protein
VTRDLEGNRNNAGGFWYSGGRHNHLGAPPGARHNAFVHNTLSGNGTESSTWGGIAHGFRGYPRIGANPILNNLVQHTLGACAVRVWDSPAVLDGNLYQAPGPVKVRWENPRGAATYTLSAPQDLAEYRRATGQDPHSRVAEAAFVDAAGGDFRLTRGSAAVDQGQPLTRTTASGAGTQVPVADVSCFSAGFRTSAGKRLIPGDEIVVGHTRARVTDVDREQSLLTVDRRLDWRKGDPVSYTYNGASPDVGAFELR